MSQQNCKWSKLPAYDWSYQDKIIKSKTAKEAAALLPISLSTSYQLARRVYPQANGVRCVSNGKRVIVDFEQWISRTRLKGCDVQLDRDPHPVLAKNGLMILWDYRNAKGRFDCGVGIKWLAKKYKISASGIREFLVSSGVDMASKMNYTRQLGLSRSDYSKNKYRETRFHVPTILRRRIMQRAQAAARAASVNGSGWFGFLGCTVDEFRLHLESFFINGMTWHNYGTLWEIDHIKPCALFDLTKYEQVAECFNYKNMQPLEKLANRSKGMKYAAA
jgi:hypothetical protein